jgi:short-subunit dehydrogenase
MRLEGARILLTGGCGGLGQALGENLRRTGATVHTAGIDEREDSQVDLSDLSDVVKFCAKIDKLNVDILINNAGLQYFGRTHEQVEISIHKLIAVNLESPIMLTKAVLPGMLARKKGQIVNIGSAFGGIPFPYFGAYSATKAGIRAFSQSIRREYRGQGILVTYIAPRALRTTMSNGTIAEFMKQTRGAMDDPERTAQMIVKAISGNRSEVSFGLAESVFSRLNGFIPSLVDHALVKPQAIGNKLLSAINT